MKTALLLSDEPKPAGLLLREVASLDLPVSESEARAGCNCDRWGHPCLECIERNIPTERGDSDFINS